MLLGVLTGTEVLVRFGRAHCWFNHSRGLHPHSYGCKNRAVQQNIYGINRGQYIHIYILQ